MRIRTSSRAYPRVAAAAALCVAGLVALPVRAHAFFGFDLPTANVPTDITAGPDGNMWFADPTHNLVGRVTIDGTVSTFTVPGSPADIVAGPDGNLWVAESSGGKVAIVSTAGAVTTEVPVSGSGSGPTNLAVAPGGGTVWYVDGNQVGAALVAVPHTVTLVTTLGAGMTPYGITAGSDGNMWVGVPNIPCCNSGFVARITTGASPTVTQIPVSGAPSSITSGPDGNLWVTLANNRIGRVVPGPNTVTTYAIPNPTLSTSGPVAITTGSDGNMWFLESPDGDIGRFSPSAPDAIATFSPPSQPSGSPHPVDIAPDPLGNLWATNSTGGSLSLLVPSGRYVDQVYHDLLGRAPEPAGLAFWTNALDTGTSETAVATSFAGSYEYRAINVTADYNLLLHRGPDAAGLAFWVGYIGSGATYEDLMASLIASDEYYNVRGGGTVDGFVTAVYNDILHRAPDGPGLQYWAGQISGGAPRYVISESFSHTTEVLSNLVQADYQALLRRPADAAGVTYWVGLLQHGTRDEQLVADLTGSDEYIFYAASHPTP